MDKSDMICRVCMDDDGENFISVFSAAAGCKFTTAALIIDCTGVEVAEGDGMPEMICSECLNAIREANKIRSKCRNTDRKLRKILNLGMVKSVDKEAPEQIHIREIATQTDEMEQPETQPPIGEQAVTILPEVFEEPPAAIEEPLHDIPVLVESPQRDVVEPEPEPEPLVLPKQEQNQPVTPAYSTEYLVEEMKECTGEDPTVESVLSSDEQDAVSQCEIVSDDAENDKHCIKIEVETLDELEYENYEAIDDDEETLQSEEPAGALTTVEIVSCCGCPCEFKSMAELRIHSELIHFAGHEGHLAILENSTCEICYKDHTSLKALAHHKANRYNRRQRMCGVCQLVLQSVRKKKQHEISHKSLPEGFHIKCCGCDHPIPFNQYGLHLEQVHKNGTELSSKYICEMCFTDCGSKQQLESHQTKSEALNQQRKLVRPAQYDDKLDIVFSDADGRQRFVCDICEKNFSTKGNLKSHRTLHDSSQKPIFKCTLCTPVRDFSKKSNYNVHMLRAHSSESLCCPDCGKSFKCSINLKTHMRVHTKERPYICGYCQKTFAHLSDKRRHEITHTHNYPFKCGRCNKPFTRKTVLDRHLESCGHRMNRLQQFGLLKSPVSQQEDPIDFMLPGQFPDKSVTLPCDLCEQWFTTVEQLADHHAQMHIQTLDEGTYETEVEIE